MNSYEHVKFDWMTYNCGHFTREVWLELTGVDLGLRMPERITREAICKAFLLGEADVLGRKLVCEIWTPVDPCLVMLRRTPLDVPHCGVFVEGALLHLPKNGNVRHQPLEEAIQEGGFRIIRYFR